MHLPGGGGGEEQVRGVSWRNERALGETRGNEPGSCRDVDGRVTGGSTAGAQGMDSLHFHPAKLTRNTTGQVESAEHIQVAF